MEEAELSCRAENFMIYWLNTVPAFTKVIHSVNFSFSNHFRTFSALLFLGRNDLYFFPSNCGV